MRVSASTRRDQRSIVHAITFKKEKNSFCFSQKDSTSTKGMFLLMCLQLCSWNGTVIINADCLCVCFKVCLIYIFAFFYLNFLRYTIKGILNLIFYGLPTYPNFYSEVCNMLQAGVRESGSSPSFTCTALYSRYDTHRLAAITGADRAAQMLHSKKPVHLFITGEENNT